MAEAVYRLPRTDERYGQLCPRCAGPKTVQASECRSCYLERCHGEAYWSKRTCSGCGGSKTPGKARCRRCSLALRRIVRTARPQPADHPWRRIAAICD
jgi:hypothetical protein